MKGLLYTSSKHRFKSVTFLYKLLFEHKDIFLNVLIVYLRETKS